MTAKHVVRDTEQEATETGIVAKARMAAGAGHECVVPPIDDLQLDIEPLLRAALSRAPELDADEHCRAQMLKVRLFGVDIAAPRLARCRLLDKIGEGGMGIVYSAYDDQLDRKLAIKVLPARRADSGTQRTRLLREAQAMAKLSHPNVVQVYEVVSLDACVYIAMEFVRGTTMGEWVSAAVRRTNEIVAAYVEAGRGLAAAHEAGIVHRDFKPGNVLVGEDGRVRVTDFGLARSAFDAIPEAALVPLPSSEASRVPHTATSSILGTPAYLSPEQHRGEPAGQRSDQFSFCVAMYEALYAERPFQGTSLTAWALQKEGGAIASAPPGGRVPQRIRRELVRGISPDTARRHVSMASLLGELTRDAGAARRKWSALVAAMTPLTTVGWFASRPGPARPQMMVSRRLVADYQRADVQFFLASGGRGRCFGGAAPVGRGL
ncbi:MAG: serine/threonine-protein kinase [Nannocystaceae bacterium]